MSQTFRKVLQTAQILFYSSECFSGHTEIKALLAMIQSYTQNPSFGDPRTFQEELDSTILKVQHLEAELHPLNLLLNKVNNQLEEQSCQRKSPLLVPRNSLKILSDSPEGSRTSSAGYGTISNYSGSDRNFDSELGLERVVALYEYAGDYGDSSIAMEAGEEFIVTEGDEGGWTKVRRKNMESGGGEGFVPFAYLGLA